MLPAELFAKLYSFYGSQGWWPYFDFKNNKFIYAKENTLFEPKEKQKQVISFGSILTQNTSWQNAMKAIISLNKKQLLSINALAEKRKKEIAKAVKPAGYYNQKTVYLQEFSKYIKENYNSSLDNFFSSKSVHDLRRELLSIKGIGNETADSILLYAGFKPIFMVDAYTIRIYNRLTNSPITSYLQIQEKFMKSLQLNSTTLNEMHALLVRHAQTYCYKLKPSCSECFLRNKCKFCRKKQ